MNHNATAGRQRHLLWVFPGKLADALDSATWLQTTKHLRALGWQVTLVCVGPAEQQAINGVAVTSIPSIDRFFLRSVGFHCRLLRLIHREWATIDIVYFHQMTTLWMMALLALRIVRRETTPSFVMDTRDLNAVDGGWKNKIRKRYYDLAHALANRLLDGQTAITPQMAKLVHIPEQQLLGLWPSGVDVERFANAAVGRRWPAPGEPIHLMYVGILLVERNLRPLCLAVEQANREGMAFELTFVGSGPDRPALAAHAAAESRIRLVPAVAHDQVPALLRGAHVGVTSLPEPDNEKFQASSPLKLFEYMAAGLPVLATRILCHTEVVQAGAYAFWAESARVESLLTTLRQLWRASDQLEVLGRQASQSVEQWSWQAVAKQLSDSLETVPANVSAPLAGGIFDF
jgi:glycosyltransferase involved in cell wall biosynthesis